MPDAIDYRDLLLRYMAHALVCEGIIPGLRPEDTKELEAVFTPPERHVLRQTADAATRIVQGPRMIVPYDAPRVIRILLAPEPLDLSAAPEAVMARPIVRTLEVEVDRLATIEFPDGTWLTIVRQSPRSTGTDSTGAAPWYPPPRRPDPRDRPSE